MRSILLHIDDDACLDARIAVALDLARAFDGHVTCVQAMPFVIGMPGDLYGTIAAQMLPEFRELADKLRARIEAHLIKEDVSWSWVQDDGPAIERLLQYTGLSDIAVIGCCDPLRKGYAPLTGDLVLRSRTPVLIVPPKAAGFDTDSPAVVAWDGSPEARRALRAAVPLLARSQAVTLATVREPSERKHDLPPTDGAEYLSRHGISCEIVELPASESIARVLTDAALVRRAGYLVMGAYGHARLLETIFGGVTRELLAHPPVPLPILACH
ncbi:MAG TPA: universal stress protein [Croceibacterium sp.]|nr:universal stress protein [Croceibacterium sp.]